MLALTGVIILSSLFAFLGIQLAWASYKARRWGPAGTFSMMTLIIIVPLLELASYGSLTIRAVREIRSGPLCIGAQVFFWLAGYVWNHLKNRQ